MAIFVELWGRVAKCGFSVKQFDDRKFVRSRGQLFQDDVAGLDESLLEEIRVPGGCLEEKLQRVLDALQQGMRRNESLEQVLRSRVLEECPDLPAEVREVVKQGSYSDSFVSAFEGQSFQLHAEEIAPGHEYCLMLEVHSGGPYWAGMRLSQDGVLHRLESVTSSTESLAGATLGDRSAERCAVLVWRWQRSTQEIVASELGLPQWLATVLEADGEDPLLKLQLEIQTVQRWEESIRQDTEMFARQAEELENPYIREVLRLWPSEVDSHGRKQMKKCAWIEGLESHFFLGRTVSVQRVKYGTDHSLLLRACIGRRHLEEPVKDDEAPPYRLTLSWQWASATDKSMVTSTENGE